MLKSTDLLVETKKIDFLQNCKTNFTQIILSLRPIVRLMYWGYSWQQFIKIWQYSYFGLSFIYCFILEAEFAFSIYDADGTNKIDCNDLGDVLRALNCNPTLALIEKMGGTKKRGEKLLSLEEFLPIYGQVKKEKDQGCYEDFLECLKLYDKNENGFMLLAELNHALLALGNYFN